TSTGSTPLPSDFEKARPCSSSVHPEVMVMRYGEQSRRPTALSSEDWNQPRCWSPPSVYRSAGKRSSGSCSSTASQEAPDSNHTSRMSISLRKSLPLQLGQVMFFGRRSATSRLYQASAPSLSKSLTMDLLMAALLS